MLTWHPHFCQSNPVCITPQSINQSKTLPSALPIESVINIQISRVWIIFPNINRPVVSCPHALHFWPPVTRKRKRWRKSSHALKEKRNSIFSSPSEFSVLSSQFSRYSTAVKAKDSPWTKIVKTSFTSPSLLNKLNDTTVSQPNFIFLFFFGITTYLFSCNLLNTLGFVYAQRVF